MGTQEIALTEALESTVLEIIHNRHYGRADDPNGDAQQEYLEDKLKALCVQIADISRPPVAGFAYPQETWVIFVREFMLTYGHEMRDKAISSLTEVPLETIELRNKLIHSEVKELFDAVTANDVVEVFDALLDLVYVAIGAMLAYGFPAEAGMKEVQRSNMTKLGEDGQPIYDADGKVVKGPNYEPPVLGPLLEATR